MHLFSMENGLLASLNSVRGTVRWDCPESSRPERTDSYDGMLIWENGNFAIDFYYTLGNDVWRSGSYVWANGSLEAQEERTYIAANST